jgi:hypothetical protein
MTTSCPARANSAADVPSMFPDPMIPIRMARSRSGAERPS